MRQTWKHRFRRIGLVAGCVLVLPGVIAPASQASTSAGECRTRAAFPADRPARGNGALPAAEAAAREHDFQERLAARGSAPRGRATDPIKVYVHVISQDETPGGGNVSDEQIGKQLEVLNADFGNTGFSFQLANTTRTVNEDWFTGASGANREKFTRELREGGAADLNLYTASTIPSPEGGVALGWSTAPHEEADNPTADGVGVKFSTLPGGTEAPFNLGRTATHGVGAWMGLYNTFQGGCDAPGDYVDDTPYEASAAYGCPEARDTCPAPGTDPIHNFMDHGDDACMSEFTAGQAERMRQQVSTYRGIN
ncbi:zinc metalloprotease [Actinokineospora diospyrosa]|uniref:Pregnancy-associated plasma protein-A n=1 Tax=Actinokineospora diospyrosa TaxID=103728 RepID=A0ABT1IEJ7_9PSEU|nr:zinc metalloprotease [Actinokineospora diospyrosa]MCP2271063.1 Pregnancy-associated plasma protein-A [Actinokineospora diospyrosa]